MTYSLIDTSENENVEYSSIELHHKLKRKYTPPQIFSLDSPDIQTGRELHLNENCAGLLAS